jgi:plasmid stabilization system protein ParE
MSRGSRSSSRRTLPTSRSRSSPRIFDAIDRAALFPRLGRQVPEFEDEMLREIIFQNYRIVYRIDGERIGVVAVRHAEMDMRAEIERSQWDLP